MVSCFCIRCLYVFFFCLRTFRVYHVGTRGEENFPSRMGEIEIRKPDG